MIIRYPDEIKLFLDVDGGISFTGYSTYEEISHNDVKLNLNYSHGDIHVSLTADTTPVYHIRFRWNFTARERFNKVKVMGDAWERSYGELEWRGIVPHRFMPWYMIESEGSEEIGTYTESEKVVRCYGVGVRPGAMCTWQRDSNGMTLWMDVRCGGDGVILNSRTLDVCRIIFRTYRETTVFEAAKKFCSEMCKDPLLPSHKVYGSNNWYYAVGDSSHSQILRDTDLIARLTEGVENRPYMVVDDGWQKNPCDGPWEPNEKFPDMARLASEIKSRGVRPGIWLRPLLNSTLDGVTEEMCIEGYPGRLDPSVPETLEYIKNTIKKVTSWGYELIKHDFTHFDLFNANGFDNPMFVTDNGWHFRDRSRTSAEIALDLYRAILDAAGDAVILACATPSHLTAGLAHLMRTGFDTSGRHFERTRISGVNTLVFRLPQNGNFYMVDADCYCHTGKIDWSLNREWLRLLADSGTTLFVSVDPDQVNDEEFAEIRRALIRNATDDIEMIPVDWMDNVNPEIYTVNGERKFYKWYSEEGTRQFIPPTYKQY
ncbi:MAG: alpha-galactosidase [Clostridia bacterium]|nr:alpha-galactosidase [Clostridia bacterium]